MSRLRRFLARFRQRRHGWHGGAYDRTWQR